MLVTYQAEGQDKLSWSYVARKVRASEAESIEARAGMTFDAFNKAVVSGSAGPRRVLLWHCLRQGNPFLRFDDVPDFAMGEVEVSFERAELEAMREVLVNADLPDDKRTPLVAAVDAELNGLAGDPDPKAI